MVAQNSAVAAKAASANGISLSGSARSDTLSSDERVSRVMALLTRSAEAEADCPGNEQIAAAVGARSASTGASMIKRLEAMGLITVERGMNERVVTIVATGKRTAGTVRIPHFRVRGFIWSDARDDRLLDAIADEKTFAEAAAHVGDGCTETLASDRFEAIRLRMGTRGN